MKIERAYIRIRYLDKLLEIELVMAVHDLPNAGGDTGAPTRDLVDDGCSIEWMKGVVRVRT